MEKENTQNTSNHELKQDLKEKNTVSQSMASDQNQKISDDPSIECILSPEIEADYVLGDFIGRLLRQHKSKHKKSTAKNKIKINQDIEKVDAESDLKQYDISESAIDSFLDTNLAEQDVNQTDKKYDLLTDEESEISAASSLEDHDLDKNFVIDSERDEPKDRIEKTDLTITNVVNVSDDSIPEKQIAEKSERENDILFQNEVDAIFETSMNFEEKKSTEPFNVTESDEKFENIDPFENVINEYITKIDNNEPDNLSSSVKVDKRKTVSKTVNEKEKWLNNGIANYRNKNYEDAIIEFKKVIKLDPNIKVAYIMLGNSFFRNKMLTEALATYEKLKKTTSIDSTAHENLGLIYAQLGVLQLAVKEWKTILELNPEKTDIEKKLEKALRILKPQKDQVKIGRVKKKLDLLLKGIEYYKNKDFESAIQIFRQTIKNYPDENKIYSYLANTFFRNKMLAEAILTYENMQTKHKSKITDYENLGFIYAQKGAFQLAINEWEKIIEKNPRRQDIKKKIDKVNQVR